ncbi:hypothetical protein FF38_14030, partial [Lucilia cuprina]
NHQICPVFNQHPVTLSQIKNCSKYVAICKGSYEQWPSFRDMFTAVHCNNCLGHSHIKTNCKSKNTCLYCKKTHHTLLHMPKRTQNNRDSSQNISKNNHISQNSEPNAIKNFNQAEQPNT